MSADVKPNSDPGSRGILDEVVSIWRNTPNRMGLLVLLLVWTALFHWLGNSTLGYVDTASMFGWWNWNVSRAPDEEHAYLMPFALIALLWMRRDDLARLEKRVWLPALAILGLALAVHIMGYLVQQTRLSVVAYSLGLLAICGLMLGRRWMLAAVFPFSLLLFSVPMGSGMTEIVSFPLRLVATKITAVFCDYILGIHVIQNGTQLLDAGGTYQYEVAAACSGIRSLTAIVAFSVIYAYVGFSSTWRRIAIVASAVPLAVIANVFRLTFIVIAAEAFGQDAGNFVHENWFFSTLPYIPAIAGMLALGWWLSEDRKSKPRGDGRTPVALAEQPGS
jgi:exosortase